MSTNFRLPTDIRSIYGLKKIPPKKKNVGAPYKKGLTHKDHNYTISQKVRKSLIDFPNIGNSNHYESNNSSSKLIPLDEK